jgi:hypothetical protein
MASICKGAQEALDQIRALHWLQRQTGNVTHNAENRILRNLDPVGLTQVALELRKDSHKNKTMTIDAYDETPTSVITAGQGNPDSIQQSSANPTFQDRADILTSRGIPVVPVEPLQKRCTMAGWPSLASTDPSVLSLWSKANPNYNTAAVAKLDGFCILDCDTPDLVERIERETGCKTPATFTVRSAGRGCPHIYFRHTDRSRALGNRHAAGLFDLKANKSYVVGPGSQLENGRTYDVVNDAAIVDFPDWLAAWIEHNSTPEKPKGFDNMPLLDDTFDFDGFLEHYGIEIPMLMATGTSRTSVRSASVLTNSRTAPGSITTVSAWGSTASQPAARVRR